MLGLQRVEDSVEVGGHINGFSSRLSCYAPIKGVMLICHLGMGAKGIDQCDSGFYLLFCLQHNLAAHILLLLGASGATVCVTVPWADRRSWCHRSFRVGEKISFGTLQL
jgi:hypothetical protein